MIEASCSCREITPIDTTPSDHAEIALQWSGRIINTWNIESRRIDHEYLKVMTAREGRVVTLISILTKRFIKGRVAVQVITNGSEQFYTKLSNRLIFEGETEFSLITSNYDQPTVTGILINKEKFSVLFSGTVSETYEEEGKKAEKLVLPYAHLQDLRSKCRVIIVGVHINNTSKKCLNALSNILTLLYKNTEGKSDVIAIGTFNSNPVEVKMSMSCFFEEGGSLLEVPYATHLNSKKHPVGYEQIAFLRSKGSSISPEVLPETALSKESQSLIHSIRRAKLNFT